jgi:hypothetical protein
LNAGLVGGSPHHPTQRVDFPHDGALGNSADRGIAGHLAYGFEILSEKEGPRSTARRQSGGLASRVAAPDHHDVVVVHWIS